MTGWICRGCAQEIELGRSRSGHGEHRGQGEIGDRQMATHPANAVFVSKDGKVSFDENGRKLDSNGNVVWKDRQGLS